MSAAARVTRSGKSQSSTELRGAWDELLADATDRVGGPSCQAPCRAVANAIEAAFVGQNAIEKEGLVLECVLPTSEVFLLRVESVVLIDCGARKTVSNDLAWAALPLRCVRFVVRSRAGWRWCAVRGVCSGGAVCYVCVCVDDG